MSVASRNVENRNSCSIGYMLQLSSREVFTLKKAFLAMILGLFLAACSDDSAQTNEELHETIEKGTVGYEIVDGKVEAAQNVPADVEKEILTALDEYIVSFNEKDLQRFEQTVSKQDDTYFYETMKEAEAVFEQYSIIERQTEDVTISKYEDSRVEVFFNINGRVVEAETESEMAASARQIIVMVKEADTWKVSSVHSINM